MMSMCRCRNMFSSFAFRDEFESILIRHSLLVLIVRLSSVIWRMFDISSHEKSDSKNEIRMKLSVVKRQKNNGWEKSKWGVRNSNFFLFFGDVFSRESFEKIEMMHNLLTFWIFDSTDKLRRARKRECYYWVEEGCIIRIVLRFERYTEDEENSIKSSQSAFSSLRLQYTTHKSTDDVDNDERERMRRETMKSYS